jgi:dienelactone hydrolase
MRTLEKLLIVLVSGALILDFVRHPLTVGILAVVAGFVGLLHGFIEKPRWQMIPAYVATAEVLVYSLVGGRFPTAITLSTGILLATSVALGTLLPVFPLPEPGGFYSVGTVTRRWTTARTPGGDIAESVPRRLTIQFWYPTDDRSGKRSLYRNEDARGLKAHLRLVRTHSFLDVPLSSAADKFPVILFSPGWKGHLTQNTVQFEMLASRGFVVASIEHPRAEGLPADFDPSLEENLLGYDREVGIRAEDIQFVLDQIEGLDQNDPEGLFTGRLDTSSIGMLGYSFGGAVTMEACWRDSRLKAGINLDGMLFGESAEAGVRQPFLFMSSDGPLPSESDLQCPDARRRVHMQALDRDMKRIQRSLGQYGGYYLRIEGAAHSNFSDRPLYSPLRRLTDAGRMRPQRAFQIINEYTLAFFEQYLNGRVQSILESRVSPYQDADFSRNVASILVEADAIA